MDALDILKEKFVGNFYSRFSVGDTFDFIFDSFWLVAHNVVSTDEDILNNFLLSEYEPAKDAVDKEDVSKSTIICSTLRKKIVDLSLTDEAALTLGFENGVTLLFPTNTDVVDWQWAINDEGKDPYLGFIVGCFNQGEVQIGNR